MSQHLVKKYEIQPYNVIGHADIAPGRKQDPGILFPWGYLFEQYNIGAWLTQDELTEEAIGARYNPKESLPKGGSEAFMSKYLSNYDYKIEELSAFTPELGHVLTSFRAHFSHNQDPRAYKEEIDDKDMFWIWALEAKYGSFYERNS
ncbi:MAG: hypothetical protein IBJ00_03045 [Alphaproteobacteria bacterium]|nr:hypothetical protein [Alphaproteobacteria bacterium]